MELPTATLPPQLSQKSTSVALSPPSQEHPANNFDRHRYPTRFSLSQKTYSMACTRKYSYAAAHLAQTLAHPIHFHDNMVCPVMNPDTGASLEYRHLTQGPDKDILVKALANDFGCLAQGVKDRMRTGNSTIFFIHPSKIPSQINSPIAALLWIFVP